MVFDLVPEVLDMGIDHPVETFEIEPLNYIDQLEAAEYDIRPLGKTEQYPELGARKGNGRTVLFYFLRESVDDQRTAVEGKLSFFIFSRPPEMSVHARDKLPYAERLNYIVVGSYAQPFNPVVLGALRGKHYDWHV